MIVGGAIKPEVDILFRGEKVEDVHLLVIKIMNNGNEHVKEEDYKKPITFEFNPDAEIMDMSTEKRSSDSIQITFNLKAQNIVEITPNLLNKKDWFIVKFLINKYEDFILSLHAIDIKKIKEYNPPSLIHFIAFQSIGLVFISILILNIFRREVSNCFTQGISLQRFNLILFFFIYIMFLSFSALFLERIYRRPRRELG